MCCAINLLSFHSFLPAQLSYVAVIRLSENCFRYYQSLAAPIFVHLLLVAGKVCDLEMKADSTDAPDAQTKATKVADDVDPILIMCHL